MPIRLRLALIVTAVASVLVLAGGIALELSLAAGMRATLQDSLRRSAARFDRELSAHRVQLAGRGATVQPTGDQSTVQVVFTTGHVRYTTARAGTAALLTAAQRSAAARGPIFVQRSRPAWHNPRLVLAEAVPGRTATVLVVGRSLDELTNARGRLLAALVVGGPLVVAMVGAGSWWLAGVALRPVEQLRVEAMAISTGHPDRRLPTPRTRDEVAKLAHTLNDLLGRLQGAIARQREFVAAASHELRTPLAVLRAEVELAQRPGRTDAELRASLRALDPRITQLVRLSDDLLLLASGDEGALRLHLGVHDLEALVASSLESLAAAATAQGVALLLDAPPGIAARVDAVRFQQIIDNLVANALQYATGSPVIEVAVRRAAERAVVEVADRGPGFPDGFLPRAFERFSRASIAPASASSAPETGHRNRHHGVGLGLAVVRLLVEAHGGTVDAANRPGGGARVVVTLPGATDDVGPGVGGDRRPDAGSGDPERALPRAASSARAAT